MYPVIDVSAWERLNTEQMGTKPKFWCLDQSGTEFLFKESRAHAGEHWSEKVAAEIAALLSLPHAEIELAVCEGKNGTISRNFRTEPSSLIHGNELLFEHDDSYPKDAPNFRLAQHTLERIFAALVASGARLPSSFNWPANVTTACDLFVGYLLLDALIVNTDRHHANWAVIISPNQDGTYFVEISPTFDHASSLGWELTDERRTAKLTAERLRCHPQKPARRDQAIVGYLEKESWDTWRRNRDVPASMPPSRMPSLSHPMQVFLKAREKLPDAAEAWLNRLEGVKMNRIEKIVFEVASEIMSQPARDFALCLIEFNRTALITRTFQYA